MIFYFSGTGNSYQAALAMQAEGEELVEISEQVWKKNFRFEIGVEEPVGFACPVYYGGLPSVVIEFLRSLELSRKPDYCYAVFTCGGDSYAAPDRLAKALSDRGYELHAAFTVVMPDNYVLLLKIPEDEKKFRLLVEAEGTLKDIRAAVDRREHRGLDISPVKKVMTAAMYPIYDHGRKTKPFFTDEQCIGCGTCVRRCPAHAMVMENDRPKWVADRCIHCMSCIRCGAVQYGKRTRGKKRYTNPILKACH